MKRFEKKNFLKHYKGTEGKDKLVCMTKKGSALKAEEEGKGKG